MLEAIACPSSLGSVVAGRLTDADDMQLIVSGRSWVSWAQTGPQGPARTADFAALKVVGNWTDLNEWCVPCEIISDTTSFYCALSPSYVGSQE